MDNRFKYIENAFLYPATNDWNGGLYTHGIGTADADDVSMGQFKFGRSLIDLKKRQLLRETCIPKKITGTYLYLGAASSHFGHFFSECISRYWALGPDFDLQINGVIVLPDSGGHSKKYVNLCLDILKLSRKDILFITDLSIVDSIIVPEPGCIIGEQPQKYYIDFLKKHAKPELFINNLFPKKILVSRRSYKNVGRLAGMDYVTAELKTKGYFEFLPEKYTILQQIQFICSADDIVWEEGSAVHLLEILPYINSRQTLIMRRELTNFDYIKTIIEQKSPNTTTFSNVEFVEWSSSAPHNKMSKPIDFEEFIIFIKSQTGALLDKEKLIYESIFDELGFYLFESKQKNIKSDTLLTDIAKLIDRDFYTYNISTITRTNEVPSQGPKPIIAWCIDYPPKGTSNIVTHKDIDIHGWFLFVDSPLTAINASLKIVSDCGTTYEIFLNVNRPDVTKAILGNGIYSDELNNCGFRITVTYDKEYKVYLYNGNDRTLLSTIQVSN